MAKQQLGSNTCPLGVACKVSNRKRLSCKKNCFLEKCLLSIFKFCASSNLLFLNYELVIGLQPTFLGCIVIFVNLIGQLYLGGPSYNSCTLKFNIECIKVMSHSGTIRNDFQCNAASQHSCNIALCCAENCCCKSSRVISP